MATATATKDKDTKVESPPLDEKRAAKLLAEAHSHHAKINKALHSTLADVFRAGAALSTLKTMVREAGWTWNVYAKRHLSFSQATADSYIRCHTHQDKITEYYRDYADHLRIGIGAALRVIRDQEGSPTRKSRLDNVPADKRDTKWTIRKLCRQCGINAKPENVAIMLRALGIDPETLDWRALFGDIQ